MRKADLPPGVNVLTGVRSAGHEFSPTLEGDLRIVELRFDVRTPFHIQALIGGEWRDLTFSNGRGRAAERGFMTIHYALTKIGELRRHVHPEVGG